MRRDGGLMIEQNTVDVSYISTESGIIIALSTHHLRCENRCHSVGGSFRITSTAHCFVSFLPAQCRHFREHSSRRESLLIGHFHQRCGSGSKLRVATGQTDRLNLQCGNVKGEHPFLEAKAWRCLLLWQNLGRVRPRDRRMSGAKVVWDASSAQENTKLSVVLNEGLVVV